MATPCVQCPRGPQGATGLAGKVGPQGVQGYQGRQGYQGGAGAAGAQGTQGAASTVAGPQGTQGAQGTQGRQGFQGVQGGQGAVGTQGFQGFQGTGAQGATGSQGPTGVQGPQGNQGAQGTQGTQGFQGNTGVQGPQGNQGTFGQTGFQGPQGVQGIQGPLGNQGFQGNQGIAGVGTQGAQGTQGVQGSSGTPPDEYTIRVVGGLITVDMESAVDSYASAGDPVAPAAGNVTIGYNSTDGVVTLDQLDLVYGLTVEPTTESLTGETVTDAIGPDGTADVMNAIASVRNATWLNDIGVQVKGRWHIRSTSAWTAQVVAFGTGYTPDLGISRVMQVRTRQGTNATPDSYVVRGGFGGKMAFAGQVLPTGWDWRYDGGPIDIWTDVLTVPGDGTTGQKTAMVDIQFYGEHDASTGYPASYRNYWVLPTLVAEFVIDGPA